MTNITGLDQIYQGLMYAYGDPTTIMIIIGIGLLTLLLMIGFNIWIAAIFLSITILLAAVFSVGMPMSVVGFAVLALSFALAVAWNKLSQGQR